jgi:hypothetical protein
VVPSRQLYFSKEKKGKINHIAARDKIEEDFAHTHNMIPIEGFHLAKVVLYLFNVHSQIID